MRAQARLRFPAAASMIHALADRGNSAMLASALRRLAAAAAAAALLPLAAQSQPAGENVVLAVPNVALTFAPGYLAEDLGLFAKHGLNVKSVVIAGIGSANAVISGSADFAQISGATLPRAAARGQTPHRHREHAQPADHPDRSAQGDRRRRGLRSQGGAGQARKLMRGRTIAVDPINSVIHACAAGGAAGGLQSRRHPHRADGAEQRDGGISDPARSTASRCRCRGRCSPCSKGARW